MTPVAYRFRAEFRRRRLAWLSLGLVVGLAGGLVIALLAGARRTDSAYQRLLREHEAYDVLFVSGIEGFFEFAPLDLDAIEAMPGVTESARLQVIPIVGRVPNGTIVSASETNFAVATDGKYGVEMNRFKLLEGRFADPDALGEILVTFPAAEQLSLSVGDRFDVNIIGGEEVGVVFGGGSFEDLLDSGPLQELEVVGIIADPNGFPPPADPTVDIEFIYFTPALLAANPDSLPVDALAVRLTGGQAAAAEFIASVEEATPGGLAVAATTADEQTRAVERGLAPLSRALLVAGGLAALVATLVVGQVLARQAFAEAADARTLDALGFTPRDHRQLRLLKAAVIGAVGATVGVVTAILLSSLFPIGLARTAEPDPGFDVDGLVVVGGAFVILAVSVALAVLAAFLATAGSRTASAPGDAPRRSALAARLASAAPGAVTQAGTGLATSQRGLASSLVGIGLGLVTVIGMLTFVASINHLRDHPRLYGWTWDLTVGGDFGEPLEADGIEELASDPDVRALEAGATLDAEVGGHRMRALATDPVKGDIEPALLSGRAPVGSDEIVLRSGVASEVALGDVVRFQVGGESIDVELVGRAVLPQADVLVSFAAAQLLIPDTSPQLVLVALQPGTDVAAFAERATAAVGLLAANAQPAELPQDLVNFGRADATPAVIAGLMGLVAAATLFHALITAVQRGRRSLGVLRALGFVGRQLVATVAWQAALLVFAALVVAIPVGIAAGRLVWLAFADQLGVVPRPTVSAVAVGLAATTALVAGVLVAGVPGWRAGRVSPAASLRAD